MFFHFLDNVFLLDPSLESPQRIFDGFTILNPNLSQSIHPPIPVVIDFRLSHTSETMAICASCSHRQGKRYCPAVGGRICAVCCGTKREIEIDCPSSCSYLKASRTYELEKRIPDPQVAAKVYNYDERLVHR